MKRVLLIMVAAVLLLGNVDVAFAEYPDPGTSKTNLFVQNMGSVGASVQLLFTTGETGGDAGTYNVEDRIGLLEPYVPKVIPAVSFPVSDGWAGAAEVQSSEPVAAIVATLWDNAVASTAGMYRGVEAPANEVYLPFVPIRDGLQTSRVTVQNVEGTEASIAIHWYDRLGTEDTSKTVYTTIPARSEKTFRLDQILPDFSSTIGIGSAYITSTNKIGAVASIHWAEYQYNSSDIYTGASQGDTILWYPSVFRKFISGCSGYRNLDCYSNSNIITAQNLGDVPTLARFEFWDFEGTLTHVLTQTIEPRSSATVNTAVKGMLTDEEYDNLTTALTEYWKGTVKVVSLPAPGQSVAQPLAGLCQYNCRSSGVYDWLVYNAIRDDEATTVGLAAPAHFRKRYGSTDSRSQWSTTLVQSLSDFDGELKIEFFDSKTNSKIPGSWTVPIPANGSRGLNLKLEVHLPQDALDTLGTEYSGSMVVTPLGGISIIGVTNVLWDGTGRGAAYTCFQVPAE